MWTVHRVPAEWFDRGPAGGYGVNRGILCPAHTIQGSILGSPFDVTRRLSLQGPQPGAERPSPRRGGAASSCRRTHITVCGDSGSVLSPAVSAPGWVSDSVASQKSRLGEHLEAFPCDDEKRQPGPAPVARHRVTTECLPGNDRVSSRTARHPLRVFVRTPARPGIDLVWATPAEIGTRADGVMSTDALHITSMSRFAQLALGVLIPIGAWITTTYGPDREFERSPGRSMISGKPVRVIWTRNPARPVPQPREARATVRSRVDESMRQSKGDNNAIISQNDR
jgi:hypothetical protein